MSYFSRFPVVIGYETNGQTVNMVDLSRRTAMVSQIMNDSRAYIQHTIKDGETDIVLSDRLYDNSNDGWIILLANEIHDYEAQWPLSQQRLNEYVFQKYDDVNAVHHYESLYSGAIVDSDHPEEDRVSVTNFQYEISVNDKKREINIPTPEAASQIKNEHKRLISQ